MSRYSIPTYATHAACVVGWDPPLGTFFARVEDLTAAPDDPRRERLWVGTGISELPSLSALAAAVQDFAVIPPAVWHQLMEDQRTIGFRPNWGTALVHSGLVRTQEEKP